MYQTLLRGLFVVAGVAPSVTCANSSFQLHGCGPRAGCEDLPCDGVYVRKASAAAALCAGVACTVSPVAMLLSASLSFGLMGEVVCRLRIEPPAAIAEPVRD